MNARQKKKLFYCTIALSNGIASDSWFFVHLILFLFLAMRCHTGSVLLRAGDVHGELGTRDGDALPRATDDPPRTDAADPKKGRQGELEGDRGEIGIVTFFYLSDVSYDMFRLIVCLYERVLTGGWEGEAFLCSML